MKSFKNKILAILILLTFAFNLFISASCGANDGNDPFYEEEHRKAKDKPIDIQRRLINTGYYTSLDDIYNYTSCAEQGSLTPGDFMYADFNADGQILNDNSDQVPMQHDNYPQTTYGWSLGFSWKNFDVSMMWYGVLGVYKNLIGDMLWDLQYGTSGNYYARPNVLNRWTPETAATATKPALHALPAANTYNQRGSTYTYQDASYLRMKTFEVSYSLSKKLINRFGMSKCQIYTNGNDLFTFTNFSKYIDPESNSVSLYPLVKRYNVGIRIGF